LILSLL